MNRIQLVLPLALLCGCSSGALDSQPDTESQPAKPRTAQIGDGELVRELEIKRLNRTPTELSTRAATLASELTSGSTCQASEAISWAQDALATGFSGAEPFSCSANVRVQYESARDVLIVENKSLHAPLHPNTIAARSRALGTLGASLSKPQAVAVAEAFITDGKAETALQNIGTQPWKVSSIRGFVDGVSESSIGTASTIRSYGVIFRRHFNEIALLDSMLEIRVDGESGQVAGFVVADIDLTTTGRQRTRLGTQSASDLMYDELQAQGPVLGFDSFTLRSEQPAYLLPPDADQGEVFPVHHALLTPFSKNGAAGHTSPVMVPMVYTDGEDFSVQFIGHRPSVKPPPGPDGSLCQNDDQCSSGSCFVLEGSLGYCGECSTSDDCPSGTGCLPPKILNRNRRGSQCVPIARGVTCESDATCSTGDICGAIDPDSPDGIKACGGCSPGDENCGPGMFCGLVFTSSQTAYRECSMPSNIGHICETDDNCISGHCVGIPFQSGRTVGVCSECTTDADCDPSKSCSSPGVTADVGFVGGTCQ